MCGGGRRWTFSVKTLKTIMQATKRWDTFYCHMCWTILKNVRDKTFLRKKSFIGLSPTQVLLLLLSLIIYR